MAGSWMWIFWLVYGIILETYALITGKVELTLSYQVWWIRQQSEGFFTFIIAILIWAIFHFVYHGKMYFKE